MNSKKAGKRTDPKNSKRSGYEKPKITVKSKVPNAPAAWGSYQPQS